MPFDRSKLENDAREITVAVERGDLITLSDVARVTGWSKETISVHISRGKLQKCRCGIDNYFFIEDVVGAYPDVTSEGLTAFRAGKWATWWKAHPRVSRGR